MPNILATVHYVNKWQRLIVAAISLPLLRDKTKPQQAEQSSGWIKIGKKGAFEHCILATSPIRTGVGEDVLIGQVSSSPTVVINNMFIILLRKMMLYLWL